jgi:hypothetical protein
LVNGVTPNIEAMADTPLAFDVGRQAVAPSTVPGDLARILRDADALLSLMGSGELCVVAGVASSLKMAATEAGASEIAEAASAVKRIASGHRPVALTGAMRELTDAIARARHKYRYES